MISIRFGIVGIGNMGSQHATNLFKGNVKGAVLTAVCDTDADRLAWAEESFGESVALYTSFDKLLQSGAVDAVIIATPHYDHPTMGIAALQAGLHLLIEKPAGVYAEAVEALNQEALKHASVFAIMYNQRTNPIYQKIRELYLSGELGTLIRVNWVITNWFRSQEYYNSGGWRATWAGEGGGVLLNQCPHQLDLMQWLFGLPKRVRAFAQYGKYHAIEVEDDVTAFLEYENGATGVFITSTGEAPGTNRLEVSGTKGKLVTEHGSLVFYRNREDLFDYTKNTPEKFTPPENWVCQVPVTGTETAHVGIMQNFTNAILTGEALISPGIEGIRGLRLSNAIHLSSWQDDWVNLPLDDTLFQELLHEKIKSPNGRSPHA